MSAITLTAAKVAQVYSDPAKAEIHNVVAAEAVTKGQTVYQTTTGTFGVCDMAAAAKDEPRGMALQARAAGEAFSMIKYGPVYGFVLTGMDYDARVFASADTAGGLDTAGNVCVGRVMPATDRLRTRVLFVDFREQPVKLGWLSLDGVGYVKGGASGDGNKVETDEVEASDYFCFWDSRFLGTGVGPYVGRRVWLGVDKITDGVGGYAGLFEIALLHTSTAPSANAAGLRGAAYLGAGNDGLEGWSVLNGLEGILTIAADDRTPTGSFACIRLASEIGAQNVIEDERGAFIHADEAGTVKLPTFLNIGALVAGDSHAWSKVAGTFTAIHSKLRVLTTDGMKYLLLYSKA